MWDLGSNSPNTTQVGSHDAPVRSVGFCQEKSLVVSGGWDKQLRFWDCRSPNPVGSFQLEERVYAMDVRGGVLAVALAGKKIVIFSLSGNIQQQMSMDSPLKYQSRCISVFPDQSGFAVGSIEGRCAIQYFQQKPGVAENFAFRCHRQDLNNKTESLVHSVNDISFHNYGTFSTVGGDGVVNFWDKDSKQRLKVMDPVGEAITCTTGARGAGGTGDRGGGGTRYACIILRRKRLNRGRRKKGRTGGTEGAERGDLNAKAVKFKRFAPFFVVRLCLAPFNPISFSFLLLPPPQIRAPWAPSSS